MADEIIRIEFITHYATHGHGQYLKDQDEFLAKLKQAGVLNKRGQGSMAEYRKELEKTHPRIVQITDDLDKLAKKQKLTAEESKRKSSLIKELKNEQTILSTLVREREKAAAASRRQHEDEQKAIRAEARELEKARKAEVAYIAEQERLGTAAAKRKAAEARAELIQLNKEIALNREADRVHKEKDRSQTAAIENLIVRMRALDGAYDRNAHRQGLWSRQVDNLTNRSTRRAISGVHEWTTTIASIALPAVPQVLSLIVGALGTVGAAAVGAAASIAKLGPGIGAVGLAITGVVQTMSVWKLAMRDFGGASGLFQSAMFDDLDTFLKKVDKVTPAAQSFALTLRGLRPTIQQFQRTAQWGIFTGLNTAIEALAPRRGLVNQIIGQTSGAIGSVIGSLGKELARPEWADAFKTIGTNNARWIEELGKAAIPTARALRDLTVAATPIMEWAVKGAGHLSKMFEQFIAGKKASGELASGVEGARKRLEDFGDIASSLGSTVLSVLKAAQPLGDFMTKGLRDTSNSMQAWTKSFEGQDRMRKFFLNMQPAIKETGMLVKDLALSMGRVAEQSSIDVLVHQLRADLLPTLEKTMIQVNKSMGPLLIETVVNLLQALTTAMGPNGPVTMMISGINQLAQAFQKLNEVFPGLRQLVGLFALFRLARLTGAIVGVSGLVRAVQGGRVREQTRLQRTALQAQMMPLIRERHPEAFPQTRVGGRFGPRVFDPSLIADPEMRAMMMEQQPSFMAQMATRSGRQALRERFATARAGGMGRLRAGMAMAPGIRTGLGAAGGVGLMLGGQVAGEVAQRAGASNRVQSIVSMAGMGAGIGGMLGMAGGPLAPVTMAGGAAIGAVVGGLAGFGMSLLGASKKVDEFGSKVAGAMTGVEAARQTRAQLAQNQRQLQFGVRGARIELRSAVAARDALTRGMTAPEFEKFTKTDVFKQAQLRVDEAKANLQDLKTALEENTKQLTIANQKTKEIERAPRQIFQNLVGQYGKAVTPLNQRIAGLMATKESTGTLTARQQQELNSAIAAKDKLTKKFRQDMMTASDQAAAHSQPYWARMFSSAINVAVTSGIANLRRNTARAIGAPATAAVARGTRSAADRMGRAGGGRITWGSSSSDSAPAMLSQGEFVVTGGGEQMLEQMTFPGVLNWLEGSQPPHFAFGGRVGHMLPRPRIPGVGRALHAVKEFAIEAHRRNVHPRPGDPGYMEWEKTHPYSMTAQYRRAEERRKGHPSPWDRPISHALLELPAEGIKKGAKWLWGHHQAGGRIGYLQGGRMRGPGDVVNRRRNDPGRPMGWVGTFSNPYVDAPKRDTEIWKTVGPWIEDILGTETGLPVPDFLVRSGRRNLTTQMFPPGSALGGLQQRMGVRDQRRRLRSERGYQRGGRVGGSAFARAAYLAPFMDAFSSGFASGEAKDPNALASIYADLVAQGTFAAIQPKTTKGKDKPGPLDAKAPKAAKAFQKMMPQLTSPSVKFLLGGGHETQPGPSPPTWQAIKKQHPTFTDAVAKKAARLPEYRRLGGMDSPGWARWALWKGGFGDVGRMPASLFTFGTGKEKRGDYMNVLLEATKAEKAWIELGTAWYGQKGGKGRESFGSKPRESIGNMTSRSLPGYRKGGRRGSQHQSDEGTRGRGFRLGGRFGRRMFQAGGRVGGVGVPTVTGAGGDAANKAWANSLMGFLQGLVGSTLGGISNTVKGLQDRVISLIQGADSSEAGQNLLARTEALLTAAETALGERIGKWAAVIDDMAKFTDKQRARVDRFLQIREIAPESPRGLAQSLMQLRRERFGPQGLGERIKAQRKVVAAVRGTPLEAEQQQKLDDMVQEAVDNGLARVLTHRALVRARELKPFMQAERAGQGLSFELQKRTLGLQIQGVTGDAASAQLTGFMQTKMLPNLQRQQAAAHTAMVQEGKRGKDTQAYRDAQDRWQQAVLATLGLQADIASETAKNTGQMVHLSGQLSFDFMGERTTDVIGSNVGI